MQGSRLRPRGKGSVSTPITPSTGSIFHAARHHSAEHKPGPRSACLQTLSYVFVSADQKQYQGMEKVWWGDCRHRPGSPLIVYYGNNDPARSITSTGFESRRHWAIMLGIWSLIGLTVGGFVQAREFATPLNWTDVHLYPLEQRA